MDWCEVCGTTNGVKWFLVDENMECGLCPKHRKDLANEVKVERIEN